MPNWIVQVQKLLQESTLVTLVTVINTYGSVPREVGARMIVTRNLQWGTIGGGNLEFSAVTKARDRQVADNWLPERQIFALGPSLGQCCGGTVEVLFETITAQTRLPDIPSDSLWCRRIDARAEGSARYESPLPENYQIPGPDIFPALTIVDEGDQSWLIERLTDAIPTVVVFGAGHVGKAVVAQLSLLPCAIVWIDERQDQLPEFGGLDKVETVQSDWPEQEVPDLPSDAWVIVMTHSHGTDFKICHALLKKEQFAFLGLIGSGTKLSTFRKRLRQRGIADAVMDRLCCPIGLAEISSSRPESIALGVAAQLVQLWEAADEK